jgi:hypothetical protein
MNTVVKDWTTEAGLRAVILRTGMGHYCGYVGVQEGSRLYGASYHDQIDLIDRERAQSASLGKKGPMLILTAAVGSDGPDLVRRSLDVVVDVHGGLTFSDGHHEYPVASDLWWFGFDCAHAGDDFPNGGQPLEYVINECEGMAKQLTEIAA